MHITGWNTRNCFVNSTVPASRVLEDPVNTMDKQHGCDHLGLFYYDSSNCWLIPHRWSTYGMFWH